MFSWENEGSGTKWFLSFCSFLNLITSCNTSIDEVIPSVALTSQMLKYPDENQAAIINQFICKRTILNANARSSVPITYYHWNQETITKLLQL